MGRNHSSDSQGRPFNSSTVDQVWKKGRIIPNYNSAIWRYDMCGQPMKYSEYGKTNSKHGWEVDHVKPVARGGGDDLGNLQPLQWEDNRRKGDTYPWSCS
jgi:hypothetical protein